jgi:TolB-like protein/DNA-binding winged helix-turn-helix (wHTH) protein/tetratricopeptide (TPR) repeat protein
MATATPAARGYRFGVFEVDLSSVALRRDGVPVRLRGKPFDILIALIERKGELVTREELRQRLWAADTFVDFDHGMNAAINRVRDALGDTADNPRFIQTIPRRGYRFIAPVEPIIPAPVTVAPVAEPPVLASAPSAEPRVANRGRLVWVAFWLLFVAAGAWIWSVASGGNRPPASPARKMIAVLTFENLSGDPEQDYFSQGITEELIGQLGALNPDALGVIARTTSAKYRSGEHTISDIGTALDVQYVLVGSVRRSGDRVRITAQLIEVQHQTQLWSDSYDHEVGDVLLTQRDVAMQVAQALTMSVLGAPTVPRMPSPAAYEAYLRGRFLRQQATQGSLKRAQEYFEEAIARDPSYAAAYAGVADVYHVLGGPGWEFGPARELLPRALEAAQRAIDLDPRAPDGYAVRGMSRLWLDWNPRAAEEDLRRAVALNPSFAQAHQYLSTVLTVQRRFDEAIAAGSRAAHLDPLSPISSTTLGYRYYYAHRYEEALREFARALELAPDFASAHIGQAQVYRAMGRHADALAAIERAVPFAGGRSYVLAHLSYAQAQAGRPADAQRTRATLEDEGRRTYVSPFHLALAAAGTGDRPGVVDHLRHAFEDRSGWMMFVPIEAEFAPYLGDVKEILARVQESSR